MDDEEFRYAADEPAPDTEVHMTFPADKTVKIAIASFPGLLPVVRAAVEKSCELMGFDSKTTAGIVLSVDEALTNVIRHAYHGRDDQPIEIELAAASAAENAALTIRIRDYGTTVDRSKIKSRDLDEVRPGGLGVHIMNQCMDEVTYRHVEGGGTLLTMTKALHSSRKGSST
jgi:anti-sigma regulatory factor (Ser/Thr protein kinase)